VAVANTGKPTGSISLLITGDEEGVAVNGTARMLEWLTARGEKIDHCIVGEPTSVGHAGDNAEDRASRLDQLQDQRPRRAGPCRLSAKDQESHSALAELITQLATHKLDKGNEHFDPSTLAFTSVDVGNEATNVIPAEARAAFNIRFNDKHTPNSLTNWVKDRAAQIAGQSGCEIDVSGPDQRRSFLDRAWEIHPTDQRHGGRHHRPVAIFLHQRRHVGCPLHQGYLSRGGTGARRDYHAQGR